MGSAFPLCIIHGCSFWYFCWNLFLDYVYWSKCYFFSYAFFRFSRYAKTYSGLSRFFAYWNKISSYGSAMSGVGLIFFFIGVVYSLSYGDAAVNLRFRLLKNVKKNYVL